MVDRRYLPILYENEPLYDYLRRTLPRPYADPVDDEFLIYIMGAYTPFDITVTIERYLENNPNADLNQETLNDLLGEVEEHPYLRTEGSVFDPQTHDDIQDSLEDIRDALRKEPGVRSFIATDADIPTAEQVIEKYDVEHPADAPVEYLTPLDQSIEFALLADFVVFVIDDDGLNNGVSAEVASILSELGLRKRGFNEETKPRDRVRIYYASDIQSATVREVPFAFDVDQESYDSRQDLIDQLRTRAKNIHERSSDPTYDFPIFYGDEIDEYPDDKV
jgi:hypothetical protein